MQPDVVLGMGGYISFPGGMMASWLRTPLVLHEQNSVAGLANRVLAGVADRILSGFPGVRKRHLGRQSGPLAGDRRAAGRLALCGWRTVRSAARLGGSLARRR